MDLVRPEPLEELRTALHPRVRLASRVLGVRSRAVQRLAATRRHAGATAPQRGGIGAQRARDVPRSRRGGRSRRNALNRRIRSSWACEKNCASPSSGSKRCARITVSPTRTAEANEELQSLNEEYRSTTEELETSKEELQSVNEELQTVNNELKMKLEEVSRANNDLENFMIATDIPMLFLDRNLGIERYTRAAAPGSSA